MRMSRSTVNRPRLALRMREKSVAANPVASPALRTESPLLSRAEMPFPTCTESRVYWWSNNGTLGACSRYPVRKVARAARRTGTRL